MKLTREEKKFWTNILLIIAVIVLMSSCSSNRGGYFGGSSWFFWNSGPSYYGNYDNRSHKVGSINGNRRYSGSGGYHSGK